jgi:hypothetical protein
MFSSYHDTTRQEVEYFLKEIQVLLVFHMTIVTWMWVILLIGNKFVLLPHAVAASLWSFVYSGSGLLFTIEDQGVMLDIVFIYFRDFCLMILAHVLLMICGS